MSELKYTWIKCFPCRRIHRDSAPHLNAFDDYESASFPCYWKYDEPYLTMDILLMTTTQGDTQSHVVLGALQEMESEIFKRSMYFLEKLSDSL